ncbi:MAG: hypothetical protein HY400_00605, partial [Elusimicrobia bacterium]|nr:hypothetical protein [Elusimicrobiota bacterium]
MRAWLGSLICLTVGLGFLMSGSPRLNEIDGSFGPVILSSGTIVSGGSLSQSLVREGISNPEAYKIEKALKGYFNPRASRPGDLYEIFKSSAGDFLKLQYWPNRLEYFTVEKSSSGILLAGREKVALRQRL